MPKITPDDVPSGALIRRWRKRQLEILKTIINKLPPDLLTEFRSLNRSIKLVRAEEEKIAREKNQGGTPLIAKPPRGTLGLIFGPRTSMSAHKRKLVAFLETTRSATRAEILSLTGIPDGSLSQLLREEDFEQLERGLWALKNKGK